MVSHGEDAGNTWNGCHESWKCKSSFIVVHLIENLITIEHPFLINPAKDTPALMYPCRI